MLNLPNKISLIRIALIPLVIFFYLADFIPYGKLVSFIIFVVASCTDFIDGMIARRRNMVTDLGKLLDPIADKCLTMVGLILIISWPVAGGLPIVSSTPNYIGIVGIVGTIIILAREFIISAFRQLAASKNFIMKADKMGKLKTVFQDIAIPGYIFYAFLVTEFELSKTVNAVFGLLLLILFCISVLLTIISGINYILKNKTLLLPEKKQNSYDNVVESKLDKPVVKKNKDEKK